MWFPAFHFVVLPILTIRVVLAAWHAYRIPTRRNMWTVVVAVALFVFTFAKQVKDWQPDWVRA